MELYIPLSYRRKRVNNGECRLGAKSHKTLSDDRWRLLDAYRSEGEASPDAEMGEMEEVSDGNGTIPS